MAQITDQVAVSATKLRGISIISVTLNTKNLNFVEHSGDETIIRLTPGTAIQLGELLKSLGVRLLNDSIIHVEVGDNV